jgi:hypothetical protein
MLAAAGVADGRLDSSNSRVDIYWLPLGAGGRSVRWNGRVYEALTARRHHRIRQSLYHAALIVTLNGEAYVIEMAPVWNEPSPERGVVREGPVGAAWLGRFPAFRYEIRCWSGGRIPDLAEAVDSPATVSRDTPQAAAVLELIRSVPPLTWGRDQLGSGEMWNSNSLVAWLLAGTGHDMRTIRPPAGGRAPGWLSGLALESGAVNGTFRQQPLAFSLPSGSAQR